MNVPNLYRKIKQILNDSNVALVEKGLNEVASLNDIPSEIGKLEINRLPYLLRNELNEITEEDLNGCTSINKRAFYFFRNIASITIPDSVTKIGEGAFLGTAYRNNNNNWENDVLYIGKHLIEAKYSYSGECEIKDGTLYAADCAFMGCHYLTSVIIPDSVVSISYNMFNNCSNLSSAIIGSGVTTIGESAFCNCYSLTSITIPNSVTTIGNSAFYNCDNLTSVTLGNSVTTIGDRTFENCDGLTSITLPESVTTIGNSAFYGCTSLTDMYLYPITPPIVRTVLSIPFNPMPTIHVPIGSGDAYKSATIWSQFADNIVEDIGVEEGMGEQ